ncbi:hypothetical protein SAMN06265338_1095 [Rhodoblastus acidophilus]|uniref:NnrS family protein n=1 Tax=Rhodoblastus acidophilus TaxID=1074 RepID=A0A212RYY2_RHOAC|nr:hypothetical protein [Rhodoblastus acidophilus]PPQ36407.1 hypothetical protein CKO16_17715 [Rhodoblastus acidophilus]RAI17654.1 hypothetical protein CH337_15840 [Rhodoblastus acidophilus]SNB77834.1 hypothetical protein SAMN06265338_1095 [Rhodoblastus acidophilus]
MTLFLASARSRLLPASVPFRFFAIAAALHVALWVALIFAAGEFTQFRGGVGHALGAAHLLTVGVLTMTAVGAAMQLLPVATTRPLAAVWPTKTVFCLLAPGALALIFGMFAAHVGAMIAGATACAAGLLLFAGLLADNLRRASSMPLVRAYGWAAFVALVLLLALGFALALDNSLGFLADHAGLALVHMILGAFGFMGLLALGLSHVLVPMFALSSAPKGRVAWAGFALAAATVAAAIIGALLGLPSVLAGACGLGFAAALLHLWLMRATLKSGMRKRLGLSFVLVRVAWAALALTPLFGLAALAGWGPGGTLFGLVALGGWLMTFLFAILQRIAPFLASMHVSRTGGGPALLSDFSAAAPLKVHACCHFAALAGLALAIVLDNAPLAALAACVGLAGALAFGLFLAGIVKTLASGKI